jgi:putative ABC transport system permease protein
MALGTAPRQVAGLVMSNVAKLVFVGLVVGSIVSWWASRFINGMLFGLEPGDLPTMGAAAAVLVCIALFASWLPARRAARIDPAQVLRDA